MPQELAHLTSDRIAPDRTRESQNMDTPSDFQFLNEQYATKFNSFCGEYLVIQTYPYSPSLVVNLRSFDYIKARNHCDIENMANDYEIFALKILYSGKLWDVNNQGQPCKVSLQQDCQIAKEYLKAHWDKNSDGEIVNCKCGYPYFSECLEAITCLVEDNGREIERCPNCNHPLVEPKEIEYDEFPNIEIVLNYIGVDGVEQTYREYFVDWEEDNRGWYDEHCKEMGEYLERDPLWTHVPAEACPLTCGIRSKKHGR